SAPPTSTSPTNPPSRTPSSPRSTTSPRPCAASSPSSASPPQQGNCQLHPPGTGSGGAAATSGGPGGDGAQAAAGCGLQPRFATVAGQHRPHRREPEAEPAAGPLEALALAEGLLVALGRDAGTVVGD